MPMMRRSPFFAPSLPGLEDKVAFLSDPASYLEPARGLEAIETHWSWVFLTECHAYKLKKPMRVDRSDLRTVEARLDMCRTEILLNRRLTEGVYLDAVALALDAQGRMRLGLQGGTPVDWLVRMRRLPEERRLTRLIAGGGVDRDELRGFAAFLARFYARLAPAPTTLDERCERFASINAENAAALADAGPLLPRELAAGVPARVAARLARARGALAARIAAGRIVEAHGDLRPEHVFLEDPPQVIDCLEFSPDLRTLDTAEELAFLALECERLGAPAMRFDLFDAYARASGDTPPSSLVDFYQAHHACVRAKLAAWRIAEPGTRDPARWAARARAYLELARARLG